VMRFGIRRVILFTTNFAVMRDFYRDVIGLEVLDEQAGWADFDAGLIRLALHEAKFDGADGPFKLAFYCEDVEAGCAELSRRGAKMGGIVRFRNIALCDGQDPDGNWFQISSRP
jgi:catechol 2,3-dioxygenase-like lactoylglutathione lyase family enzyme